MFRNWPKSRVYELLGMLTNCKKRMVSTLPHCILISFFMRIICLMYSNLRAAQIDTKINIYDKLSSIIMKTEG